MVNKVKATLQVLSIEALISHIYTPYCIQVPSGASKPQLTFFFSLTSYNAKLAKMGSISISNLPRKEKD